MLTSCVSPDRTLQSSGMILNKQRPFRLQTLRKQGHHIIRPQILREKAQSGKISTFFSCSCFLSLLGSQLVLELVSELERLHKATGKLTVQVNTCPSFIYLLLTLNFSVSSFSQTTSTLATSSLATTSPSPSNLPLAHGISNGSAFAAATTLDGTKHVIFQDVNNTLRQAVSINDNGDWDASLSSTIASDVLPLPDARPSTPITAFLRLSSGPCEPADQVHL